MMLLDVFVALACLPCVFSTSPHAQPQYIFSNPKSFTNYKIPTIHESAVLARRILKLSWIGSISTVFPSSNHITHQPHGTEDRPLLSENNFEDALYGAPDDLAGSPIALMEYYAGCGPHPYNPTILAISIATYIRNARSGSNVSLSLRWHPPATAPPTSDPYLYSPANLPRFSLQGYIEPIPEVEVEAYGVKECFLEKHGEVIWTPGNDIHESWWGRIVVQGVYWFGGFGDRARIGWLPLEEWKAVTEEEIAEARLQGEHGYEPPVTIRQTSDMEL